MAAFTTTELQEAFAKVANKADWKAPIFAVVPADELLKAVAAIDFMTGTTATVKANEGKFLPEGAGVNYGSFVVESIGYRAGPAGP